MKTPTIICYCMLLLIIANIMNSCAGREVIYSQKKAFQTEWLIYNDSTGLTDTIVYQH